MTVVPLLRSFLAASYVPYSKRALCGGKLDFRAKHRNAIAWSRDSIHARSNVSGWVAGDHRGATWHLQGESNEAFRVHSRRLHSFSATIYTYIRHADSGSGASACAGAACMGRRRPLQQHTASLSMARLLLVEFVAANTDCRNGRVLVDER